jgi:uncharacterized CHY-type Zn-finger protein
MTEPAPMQENQSADDGSLHQIFKCGGCAAKMEFKPGANAQKCPFCGHENPIPKSEDDIKELDLRAYITAIAAQEDTTEHLTIKCQACAAETTADPNVTAHDCAFCGTPIVATAASTKHIKPKSLLPFHITRKQGWDLFTKWINALWFAPGDLKRLARQENRLNGMYVPYWTYDSDTTSFYRGQRGEHYYVTEHYTTRDSEGKSVRKTRRVRKTRWWPVSGTVWASFDDILVLACNSLPRKYTEKLEPWDLKNLAPYKDEYLSGFGAESYQVDLGDGFEQACKTMDARIRSLVRRDIGGDEQRIHSVRTQHDNVTFKHILLPIWISTYRYSNKPYRFLINGRTGEVQGERPWSWAKILLLVLGITVAVAMVLAIAAASQA